MKSELAYGMIFRYVILIRKKEITSIPREIEQSGFFFPLGPEARSLFRSLPFLIRV